MSQCSPDIAGVLQGVHSALDEALGDTDVSHIENDDELREEHPVQWAAFWLAHVIEELPALLQPARLSAAIETPPRPISRDELHAIGHARYLVEQATADNPEVCFDYELVRNLLDVIDRDALRFTNDAQSEQEPRLAERLTDVVMMLDTPDAYNREYISAVCRSILSSVSSPDREGK